MGVDVLDGLNEMLEDGRILIPCRCSSLDLSSSNSQ